MWFSPKIAGALDVLLAPEVRRAFGGAGRFIVNFVIETVYSILLCPILWIGHTIFLVWPACSVAKSAGSGRSATIMRCL